MAPTQSAPDLTLAELVCQAQERVKLFSLDDTLKAWKELSDYVLHHLLEFQPLNIEGLGTFAISKAGTLVFILSNGFQQQYNVKQQSPPPLAPTPIAKMNWSKLAKRSSLNREHVQQTVQAIIAVAGEHAKKRKSVRLSLAPALELLLTPNGTIEASWSQQLRAALDTKARRAKRDEEPRKLSTSSTPMRRPPSAGVRPAQVRPSSGKHPLGPSLRPRSAQGSVRPLSSGSVRHHGISSRQEEEVVFGRPSAARRNETSLVGIFGGEEEQEKEQKVLARIRDTLTARLGANGLHTIARLFRILDNNGDKKLSAEELNYGLRDFGIDLSPKELDILVHFLDNDGSGSVSFDELLSGLRGELNEVRKRLIDLAFDQLDVNGNDEVSLQEMLELYDASKHPDVVARRKTKEQVVKEFMQQWERPDISNNYDNLITREEFYAYYRNVSASIDDDGYFELMIRNAWHIAGGKGAAANSSNRRVLVQGEDGNERVEEVRNDIRIRGRDEAAIRNKLQQDNRVRQGEKLGYYGSIDATEKPRKPEKRPGLLGEVGGGGRRDDSGTARDTRYGMDEHNRQARRADKAPQRHSERHQEVETQELRSPAGRDTVRRRELAAEEQLRYNERRSLSTHSGRARTSREIIDRRRSSPPGTTSKAKSRLEEDQGNEWDGYLNGSGDEALPPQPALTSRRPVSRPSSGGQQGTIRLSKEPEEKDAILQLKELLYTPKETVITANGGTTTLSKALTLEEMTNRLGANRVLADGAEKMNVNAFAHQLLDLTQRLNRKDSSVKVLSKRVAQQLAESLDPHGSGTIDLVRLHEHFQERFGKGKKEVAEPLSTVERLRLKILQSCGGNGIHAVQRALGRFDDNGDRKLTREELKSGLAGQGLLLNARELDDLFTYLDRDKSNSIDFDELMIGLRGPMNERRLRLVHQAFDILDRTGDGQVDLHDLEGAYDVSQHPQVLDGTMTKGQALKEFLDNFQGGKGSAGERDEIVTREEFEEYYRNISAAIDGDDYFELMIRNAWHISGGKGWCENTSNRRVLVTNKDGSQTVEEVTNDIGIRRGDQEAIRGRLRQQGIDAASLEYSGYVDDSKGPTKGRFSRPGGRKDGSDMRRRTAEEVRSAVRYFNDGKKPAPPAVRAV